MAQSGQGYSRRAARSGRSYILEEAPLGRGYSLRAAWSERGYIPETGPVGARLQHWNQLGQSEATALRATRPRRRYSLGAARSGRACERRSQSEPRSGPVGVRLQPGSGLVRASLGAARSEQPWERPSRGEATA